MLAASLASRPSASQNTVPEPAFEFAGTQRARYESLVGQFLSGLDGRDEVLALQTSLRFEAGGQNLRFVGEILDSRAEGNDEGSLVNNTIVNTLEPLQAYLSWTDASDHARGVSRSLRIGRMTLDVGKRRLLSRNRFRNTVNAFIGADWEWRREAGGNLRAFYLAPVRQLPSDAASLLDNEFELDAAMSDTVLAGLFYELPRFEGGSRIETYALRYEAAATDALDQADLVSIGSRAYRSVIEGWHYEVEAIVQRGDSGVTVAGVSRADQRHSASFLHFEVGYRFNRQWWPDLTLQYDRASGDGDPFDAHNERFNTLFGDRRFDFGPTGIYGPFQRSNLETPGVRLTFSPTSRLQGMFSYRSFRLAASRDAWIGVWLSDPTGTAGRALGSQLEGSFNWDVLPDRLSLDVGFAALRFGRFAETALGATAPAEPHYYYAALTTRF